MIRPLPFAQAEAHSHSLISDEFAEYFIWQPMVTKPNWPAAPDRSRGAQCVRLVFIWDNKEQRLGMREAQITSRKPMASISLCDLLGVPKRGDMFTRHTTGDAFEVTKVERDGLSGITLEFVQLGVQD